MPTDANQAYQQIKEMIVTLQLPPGAVIHDAELVGQLGLGRTPIREALKLLEAEKLIVTVPRRGIFVSNVAITDLQQISEVRMELEGLAARLAAERANNEEIAALHMACEEELDAAIAGAVEERIAWDRKMHRALAEAAHNKFLEAEVERFYDLSLRLWYLAMERLEAYEVDIASHQKIVKAVEQHDGDRAESLMHEHIRVFQQTVKRVM